MNKELEEAIKRLKSKLKNDGPYIENCNPFSDLVHEIILDNKAIETVLNYIDNSIPKEVMKDKIKELEKQYKEALEENNTKAFILKCQIEGFKDFKKELLDNE